MIYRGKYESRIVPIKVPYIKLLYLLRLMYTSTLCQFDGSSYSGQGSPIASTYIDRAISPVYVNPEILPTYSALAEQRMCPNGLKEL
ncbi:hypothetical protein XENTR_v10022378 [Xenopus tropicalis]|nr:hypothetical protein XENTR_v10022378 [Xenopus tropicalis]